MLRFAPHSCSPEGEQANHPLLPLPYPTGPMEISSAEKGTSSPKHRREVREHKRRCPGCLDYQRLPYTKKGNQRVTKG